MLWLILLGILLFLFYSKSLKRNPTEIRATSSPEANKGHGTTFLPPIPDGFQIFSPRLYVAGVSYHKDAALRFAQGEDQSLALEPEPDNPNDPNAIKVIGVMDGRRSFIGYVPKEEAEQIVGSGLLGVAQPRLERIWRKGDYVEVIFQIIGPKVKKSEYHGWLDAQPAESSQKEFLKFFDQPFPKGLTFGQANLLIAAHRKKLQVDDKVALDEWEAYVSICDDFDDADFRSIWELKKVSRTLLQEAIDSLKQEGATMRDLAGDIERVVNRIVKVKPELKKN